MTDITAFIAEESSKYSNLADDYQALNSFYENKQYHQLTEKLDTIVKDRSKWSGTNMVDLYKKFIRQILFTQKKLLQIICILK